MRLQCETQLHNIFVPHRVSTPFFVKIIPQSRRGVEYIIQYGIIPPVEKAKMEKGNMTLIEYIQRIMREKNLSGRDIARLSKRSGNKGVSHGYVSKLLNYDHINLTTTSLCSIAAGLGRPEIELFNAARGMRPEWGDHEERIKERVWDVFARLPKEQQAIFESIVESFADSGAGLDSILEDESAQSA